MQIEIPKKELKAVVVGDTLLLEGEDTNKISCIFSLSGGVLGVSNWDSLSQALTSLKEQSMNPVGIYTGQQITMRF